MNWQRGLLMGLASAVLLGTGWMPAANVSAKPSSYVKDPKVEDVGPKLREDSLEKAIDEGRLKVPKQGFRSFSATKENQVGDMVQWPVSNDVTGKYDFEMFTLRAIGKYGEVWVANDLDFPEGDPRNDRVRISDEKVKYLLDEFDHNMYEKEVEFFAPPKERTGTRSEVDWYREKNGRVAILVTNIKDANFYDPNYPSYIAGYFSPTVSEFADRNVMTIDNYDWDNRTGPDAPKPYLYEGTFAHEFQHLLHHDTDSAEENFINEGLSDFAQYIVGYGHSTGHVDFFMDHPKNSLVLWGDRGDLEILGDYGNAYLFQLYLYEQFGEKFTRNLFQNRKQGIAGINDVLSQMGKGKNKGLNFEKVYADYMTALIVDAKYKGSDRFQFRSIDLKPDMDAAAKLDATAPAWGTDFKVIQPDKKIDHLYFKGIDFLGTKWKSVDDSEKGKVLWGNTADQGDHQLLKELDLTGLSQATLTFDHKYEIEEEWDYGMVQVSVDGGKTWTSLANENTRDEINPNGYPAIKENLPGFTGSSQGWTTETFDLSKYTGRKILLNFRYMTDWAFNDAGWYVSNLRLNGEVIDPMTSTAGFMSLEEAVKEYVYYQVQFVGYQQKKNGKEKIRVIQFPDLLNMKDQDRIDLRKMLKDTKNYDRIIMMVTYAAPQGKAGDAPYEYEVVKKRSKKK